MAPKQGQPPPKPKPEELIAAFKEKFEAYRDETKKSVEDIGSSLEKIRQQDEEILMSVQKQNEDHSKLIQEFVDDFSMKINKKCADLKVEVMAEFDKMAAKLSEETGSSEGCEGQINGVAEVVEDIQDKLIEFEERKRNNLIFYGVKGETRETPAELVNKITSIIRCSLDLKKDVTVSSVTRVYSGPKVGSCRPVVVTFEEMTAREEVLRKAGLLKGSNVFVTEDMSRSIRGSQKELRKFMRDVKRGNPSTACNLQYDKLWVGGRCYRFDMEEGRVVGMENGEIFDRPGSVLERSSSSMMFKAPASPTKKKSSGLTRAQSCNLEEKEEMIGERDETIRELQEAVDDRNEEMDMLKETVRDLQEKLKLKTEAV